MIDLAILFSLVEEHMVQQIFQEGTQSLGQLQSNSYPTIKILLCSQQALKWKAYHIYVCV